MKKYMLCVSVVFLSTQHLQSQNIIKKDTELVYDLMDTTGRFPADFSVKKGARVRYRIINFNKNVYSITVNSTQRTFFGDKPPLFNLLTDIDLAKLNVTPPAGDAGAAIDEPLSGLRQATDPVGKTAIEKYLTSRNNLDQLLQKFDLNYKKLKKLNLYYKNLQSKSLDACQAFTAINKIKVSSTKDLLTANFSYNGTSDELALQEALENNTLLTFETLQTLYNDIIKAATKRNENFVKIESAAEKATENLQEEANMAAAKKIKDDEKKAKDKASKIYNEILYERQLAEATEDLVNDVKNAYKEIDKMEQEGFTAALINTYKKINRSNFEYVSPSFRASKDEMTVTINIEPKENTTCNSNYAQLNGEYIGNIYGFKMNFSTGLFILAGDDLFDQTYKVDTIPGDPDFNIIKQNRNKAKVRPAIGALMHFYWKTPHWFSFGPTFGASVSNETKLNYHGGISLLFGEESRIILSIGATLTQAKQISDEYEVGQRIPKDLELSPVPTTDFHRWGYFFALTYNLTAGS